MAEPAQVFDLPEPPRRDPVDLIRRLKPDQYAAYLSRPEPEGVPVNEGDTVTFNVILDDGGVEITAVAERVSEHAYFFFDTRFPQSDSDVDRAVERFETEIWPSVTGVFGPVAAPGVDGDPRMVILHTTLGRGVGGYFSAADAFPKELLEQSNERDMIYVSSSIRPGTDPYSGVLAHELQHAVNFAGDRGEEAWLNEGLSELAATRAGFPAPSYQNYFRDTDTQLTSWPSEGDTASSYGAAFLFSEYLIDHYGGEESISTLISQEADGFASIDTYLDDVGADDTALEVFRNWTVANLLNEEGTLYGYPNRDAGSLGRVTRRIAIDPDEYRDTVNQFGADYWVVTVADDDTVRMLFDGSPTAQLIPTAAHSGSSCWWSNSGDTIDTTLTRRFDLTGIDTATLEFAVWYDIEELWDYAYIEVSIDGGETWLLLDGRTTTDENPNGTGYGAGLTGNSGGWIDESVDLSEFAGGEVLIRFEYVTDDAVNINGACFDDIAIPEIGFFDDAESDGEWVANGFARIDPEVPQEWFVTLVRRLPDAPAIVTPVEIVDGRGEAIIEPIPRDEDVFLVISAVTPLSITPSGYTLNFEVAVVSGS
ncbi:MAG: immune inhibitor A [Chloroflexi bacterium]|nr:immune inhibitor A [Chloroflexota bacterium]